MSDLKDRLRTDLTAAMKARDSLRASTLRMTLTEVTNAEVAGTSARELSDAEVLEVLDREAKKRREAADAFEQAGRGELAGKERAEGEIIAEYLPAQLSDEELSAIVGSAVDEVGASGMKDMGKVMKLVQPQVKGRAEGGRVAAAVRSRLG
ncbi:GatB/YqeY domain-containing protein [Actinopolymorpha sp. NPDC004070]|uniref:GatB/YqeY domain-containing protein n=1 Tax=Actinopolymorpha sp. NPDC004070 TaxID=3154548 RepID=UPI0033B52E7D